MSTKQVNSQQRLKKQKEVKEKIEEIMHSVKQQKQFIQNKLATNDQKIQIYCEEYQALKQLNDFTHLKKQEDILLDEIAKGLEKNRIDPKKIIGGQEMGIRKWQNYEIQNQDLNKLSNEKIIAIQTMLIDKLASQVKQKTNK